MAAERWPSPIRTITVGPGLSPGLPCGSRAWGLHVASHRRSGITPCPEGPYGYFSFYWLSPGTILAQSAGIVNQPIQDDRQYRHSGWSSSGCITDRSAWFDRSGGVVNAALAGERWPAAAFFPLRSGDRVSCICGLRLFAGIVNLLQKCFFHEGHEGTQRNNLRGSSCPLGPGPRGEAFVDIFIRRGGRLRPWTTP